MRIPEIWQKKVRQKNKKIKINILSGKVVEKIFLLAEWNNKLIDYIIPK